MMASLWNSVPVLGTQRSAGQVLQSIVDTRGDIEGPKIKWKFMQWSEEECYFCY